MVASDRLSPSRSSRFCLGDRVVAENKEMGGFSDEW